MAAAAVLGGASGSSAPGQMVVLSGVSCSEADDTEDLEFLVHPLGFRIGGVPAAGAVVGNLCLSVVVMAVLTAMLYLFKTCGLGTNATPRKGQHTTTTTTIERSAGMMRYPSVLAPIPLLLLPGAFQSALDIILYPRGTLIVSLIGWSGLLFILCGMAFLWRSTPPPLATTVPVPPETGRVSRFFLGSKEWQAYPERPLFVASHGVVFDIYNELPWVRGRYFLLELAPIFPLAAIAIVRSTDPAVCATKCAGMALVIVIWTVVILRGRVFIAPAVTILMVAGNTLMLLGLMGHSMTYARGHDAQHWGIEGGMVLFAGSLMVSVGRAVYDFGTLCVDLYQKFRSGISGNSGHVSQCTWDDQEMEEGLTQSVRGT